jgi:CheY-like chemotaxis protein
MTPALVLVVEDHPLNLRLVRDILERRGHEVDAAASVGEARDRLAGRRPDIVLCDLDIPGGGGELLLREIRGDPRLSALPVLAVTAFAMQGDRERVLAAGFDGYFSKPIDTRSFGPGVEAFLRGK